MKNHDNKATWDEITSQLDIISDKLLEAQSYELQSLVNASIKIGVNNSEAFSVRLLDAFDEFIDKLSRKSSFYSEKIAPLYDAEEECNKRRREVWDSIQKIACISVLFLTSEAIEFPNIK